MSYALILSGGTGTRLGSDIPKQYIEAGSRPVIAYCIEQLSCHEGIDAIQIVAAPQWHERIRKWLGEYDKNRKFRGFSEPGETRQLSICQGLRDIREYASDEETILIHDAARPFLSRQMITECLEAVKGHDGVLPVLPMKDTVYTSADGKKVDALLNRSEIYAGQAPEAFKIGAYYEANRKLYPDRIKAINGSTEPAVMAGMDVVMIPGDEKNFKITTKQDLERFCELVKKN